MSRAVVRRAIVALPVVALVATGCSIHEQTQIPYTPSDGMNTEAGPLAVRNVLVVADGDNATVLASMVNNGESPDELVSVEVGDVETAPATPVPVPVGEIASVGFGPDQERVDVVGSGATAGSMITVELRFAAAPRAEVDVFVVSASGIYADAFADFTGDEAAAQR